VTGWLPGTVPIGDAHELAVATCLLREGDPIPVEHDATRWLTAAQLDDVDWLDPDLPFLPSLRASLEAG
jgi:8-oxo-dGTP diphosphatase